MAAATASPHPSTATAMDPPPTSRSVRHSSPAAAAAAMQPPPSATSQTLKTPLSSTYPNSIHSPLQSTAPRNKFNSSSGDIKTPLTPPSAYLDFLRVLSPNPYTPSPLSTGTSTRFSHDNSNFPSPAWPSATLRDEKHLLRPIISSARSTDSGSSFSSASSASSSALSAAAGAGATRDRSSAPPQANTSKPLHRPSELAFGRASSAPTNGTDAVRSNSNLTTTTTTTTTTITSTDPTTGTRTTEITRPQTARAALQPGTPRLIIPPSPSSTIETMSPAQHSAPATTANVPHSATPPSAMSATAHSAVLRSAGAGWTPASAVTRENLWAKATGRAAGSSGPHNPRAPTSAGGINPGRDAKSPAPGNSSSPVTIKHVVTRTVTYHRRSGVPPVQGPARPGAGAAAAAAARGATAAQSPLSAVEAIPEESEEEERERKIARRPLIGDAPRGKRRRVE